MKVAILDWVFPGPLGVFSAMEAKSLLKLGHDVEIWTTRRQGAPQLQDGEIECLLRHTKHIPRRTSVKAGLALTAGAIRHPRALLACSNPDLRKLGITTRGQELHAATALGAGDFDRSAKPDLVHVKWAPLGARFVGLRSYLKVPYVVSFNGMGMYMPDRHPAPDDLALLRRGYKRLAKSGDGFVAVSHFMRDRMLDLGFPDERIVVVPEGSDLSSFSFFRRNYEAVTHWRFVSTCRLERVKGVDVALRALSVIKNHLDFTYVVVGDGPERTNLERLSHELGLSGHVSFVGFQPWREINEIYRSSHMFLYTGVALPTGRAEAAGGAPREAAATGLVTITSDAGGAGENVVHEVTGLRFRAGDVEELIAAIYRLVSLDNSNLQGMSLQGRQYVHKMFERQHCDRQLSSWMETLCS